MTGKVTGSMSYIGFVRRAVQLDVWVVCVCVLEEDMEALKGDVLVCRASGQTAQVDGVPRDWEVG